MRVLKLLGLTLLPMLVVVPVVQMQATEALTGFDGLTNGDNPSQTSHDANGVLFAEHEEDDEGLGPTFNADSCATCHSEGAMGGSSQLLELRAGNTTNGVFTDHVGGSLLHTNCIDPACVEHARGNDNTFALRRSLGTLGDGYVEAIANQTFTDIRNGQPSGFQGTMISVPVFEAPGTTRIGRFGWKNQQASLQSFAADAYLNEMGITNPLQPTENTSDGNSVAAFDEVDDPEDPATAQFPFGTDTTAFASFMRATKAPPRGPITPDVTTGSFLFDNGGCAFCHTRNITTAAAGTAINGGRRTVSTALGNKIIHPFGDFMLHDIGTGDGIVQNGGAGTRNMVRTAPLWGLRVRNRFMHDGNSFTMTDAINRHAGTGGTFSRNFFNQLDANQKRQLLAFLSSL